MFTASSIWKLKSKPKTGGGIFGQTALTYIDEKIAEIITGEGAAQAKGASLDWGNAYEKDAAMWMQKIVPFEYMGKENFKFFEYNQFSGGSPDGLSDTHVVELKCPYVSANHIGWLKASKAGGHNTWLYKTHPEYYAQVQFNMMCCKKEQATIASYDPRTVEHTNRMAILCISKDEAYCSDLDMRVTEGAKLISETLSSLA